MTIGEKIKTLMQQNNLTPENLAVGLEVSTSSVRKYFNKENFDTALLNKISNYFQVPITYFFEDHTTQNTNNATGQQSIAGNNNTIAGNITLVLPPKGSVKIINSQGEVSTVEAASLEKTSQPVTKAEPDKDSLIIELQKKVSELQEKIIGSNPV